MKFIKGGRNLRSILGTSTFFWPLTHPPTHPPTARYRSRSPLSCDQDQICRRRPASHINQTGLSPTESCTGHKWSYQILDVKVAGITEWILAWCWFLMKLGFPAGHSRCTQRDGSGVAQGTRLVSTAGNRTVDVDYVRLNAELRGCSWVSAVRSQHCAVGTCPTCATLHRVSVVAAGA